MQESFFIRGRSPPRIMGVRYHCLFHSRSLSKC